MDRKAECISGFLQLDNEGHHQCNSYTGRPFHIYSLRCISECPIEYLVFAFEKRWAALRLLPRKVSSQL